MAGETSGSESSGVNPDSQSVAAASENEPYEVNPEDQTAASTPENDTSSYEPVVEEVYIAIPNLEREYTILWISDLHICLGTDDEGVLPEYASKAQERNEMLRSLSGRSGEDTWNILSEQIDSMGADYVVFGADMLDYVSEANLSVLKAGMEKIQTPWMYIRADHDYGRWYTDMGIKKMRRLHREIAPQNKIWVERFEGFTLVGLDNTTTSITDETLEEFKKVYEEGNPVILCTHVPFVTGSSDSGELAEISKELWGGRVLCWGEETEYDTLKFSAMQEVLEMIEAPDSLIKAVFSGHLHTSWEGWLSEKCLGHVFSAAFEDHIGIIHIH